MLSARHRKTQIAAQKEHAALGQKAAATLVWLDTMQCRIRLQGERTRGAGCGLSLSVGLSPEVKEDAGLVEGPGLGVGAGAERGERLGGGLRVDLGVGAGGSLRVRLGVGAALSLAASRRLRLALCCR